MGGDGGGAQPGIFPAAPEVIDLLEGVVDDLGGRGGVGAAPLVQRGLGVAGLGVVGEIPLSDPAPLGVVGDPDRPGAAAVAGEFDDAPGAVGSLHVRGLPSKQMFSFKVFEKPPGGAAFFKSASACGFDICMVALRRKVWYSDLGAARQQRSALPLEGSFFAL